MRVLFVTAHKHVPERWGGMEVTTHALAIGLTARGVPAGVLWGLAGVGMVGLCDRVRIRLLGAACPRDALLGYPVWRAWDPVPYVERVASKFAPDVVVIQGGDKFVPLVEAALRLGRPVLCYLHTPDRYLLDAQTLENERLSFIVNSNFTALMHKNVRIRAVIRPLVPRQSYETKTDRSAVVFVNPAPYKGLAVALALARARPDVPFSFVRIHVASRASPNEYRGTELPNVTLTGPYRDMRSVYRKARLVLAPSCYDETWGRIATEAHISGIPVLASDRGGLPEAVGPGGVCLADDAPASRWQAVFNRIWDDREYYDSLCAAARRYSLRSAIAPETIIRTFRDVCVRLASQASPLPDGGV